MAEVEKPDIGRLAAQWWHAELGNSGAGRAARAALRQCDNPVEVLVLPTTHLLNARLGGMQRRPETLALIAVALANLRENRPETAAARFGGALSAIRFQGLMRAEGPVDLIRPLRRALAQIDCAANVAALARDLFYWGEAVRNRWCFDYYGASLAAPEQLEETKE